MALVLLLLGSVLPLELIPELPLNPDDEAVYQTVEDSLATTERERPRTVKLLVRYRTDSLGTGFSGSAGFVRVQIRTRERSAVFLLDKDVGEANPVDFIGGGIALTAGRWRISGGDLVFDFGRGLLFSGPQRRSRFNLVPESFDVLTQSAQENRNLRGVMVDCFLSGMTVTALATYSLRDARLNPDGTIARLNFSGVHDDSSAIADRAQAGQLLLGASGRYFDRWGRFEVGSGGQWVRFNRDFAPTDSTDSFYGRSLGGISVYFRFGSVQRSGEIEVVRSFPGGFAGAARIRLRERGVNGVLGGAVYQERFFAPAGRVYSLARRKSRMELSGRLDYETGPLGIGLTGNTHRDYFTDSIPAKVEIDFRYESRPVRLRLVLDRKYRMETERSRATMVEMETGWRWWRCWVFLGDEYAEHSQGQGKTVGINMKVRLGITEWAASGARFFISGDGVRMTVPEFGPMRVGSSYSSGQSGWRLSFIGVVRVKERFRLGAKMGWSYQQNWVPDFGLQLEMVSIR